MPKLVSLYIRQCLIGFALAGAFTGALFYYDVARLGYLVTHVSGGWLAALMLFVFNGLVFAGVQFAITVMRMGEEERGSPPGRMVRSEAVPVPVRVRR